MVKRLLSLDGGGLLGVVSLKILREIERQIRGINQEPNLRLRDFFDYIGGTSTGAIIAAGLMLGKSVEQLEEMYRSLANDMFTPLPLTSLKRITHHRYSPEPLRRVLKQEFGERTIAALQRDGTLPSDKHLMIVMRNLSLGTTFPISTAPGRRYNEFENTEGHRNISLWQAVRASTAAPTYFPPETVELGPKEKYLFEDGGITPHNNPAWLLFKMATVAEYDCCWPSGEDRMMLISVGTGDSHRTFDELRPKGMSLLQNVSRLPSELLRGSSIENDINCRVVGRCVYGPRIENLGKFIDTSNNERKAFLYARYDADLSEYGLRTAGFGEIKPDSLRMDNVDAVPSFERIGHHVSQGVNLRDHFGPLVGLRES